MAEDVKKSRDAGEGRRRLRRFSLKSDIGRVETGITQWRRCAGGSSHGVNCQWQCQVFLFLVGADTLSRKATRKSRDRSAN